MSDIEFVDGLIAKPRREGAPDFIVCSLSMKRIELIEWLTNKDGEWVNVDIKNSKAGKMYAAVNNFKPKSGDKPKAAPAKETAGGSLSDDIPFSPLPRVIC